MPIPKNICIFEDEQASNLLPLTYTRPVFDLLCGTVSLAQRIQRFFPKANVFFKCRDYLAPLLFEQKRRVNIFDQGECLFINGRVLFDQAIYKKITSDSNATFMHNDTAVAFWNTLSPKKASCDATLIQYPWDLISNNSKMIAADFKSGNQTLAKTKDGGSLIDRRRIFIGKNSRIRTGAVLDATDGPIIIGPNVTVMSNAVVEGPCFIGNQSIIKIGAKIYGGTSMGTMCKIGGEVEASIIHGFSNKQHDGFLGHSYIGEWCNLGADTNTSDLKNNYSPVKVRINGNEVNSGQIFIGLIMGDHSKSGINTMFNTGSVVGVSSNIFGSGFPPKTIPSFAWVNSPASESYQWEKAIEVARIVMERRKVMLTPAYRQLLETIFDMTKGERRNDPK
jgi:UDP-N-acetylglucosamine diphosphorylase/glucosamine-1-phosphate N-acetyltransferase